VFIDGTLWKGQQDSIQLKNSQNLTILIANPNQNIFYYFLENYDTAYNKSLYPIAIYNNLQKGIYHFNLSITPKANLQTTKKIVIIVESSFFEEWGFFPFLLLYLTILFGGAGYIILISKLRSQNKFSELRTDWTNKLHNDIGGDLSGISIRLNSLKRKLAKQPNLEEKLLKITNTLKKVQKKLRTAFDLIDERKISINIILSDIQNFAEESCEEATMQLDFNNKLEANRIYQIDEKRTNVLHSLMKESINNLMNHSQANLATIYITEKKDGIQILIEDDGVGFDVNQSFSSNGIHNLKSYSQKGAMDINIQSEIDKGTKISIFAPYL